MIAGPAFLGLLCFLAVQAELVQIVTPQAVEYVTPVAEGSNSTRKRDAANGNAQDSYLAALKDVHGLSNRFDPPEETQSLYEDDGPPYGPPQSGPQQPPEYGLPQQTYDTPQQTYGPPQPTYDPPQQSYGPVQPPEYGPPKGYQNTKPSYHSRPTYPSAPVTYGPASPVSYLPPSAPASYGIPFAAPSPDLIMSFLSSLQPKALDLKVIFKIAIKLVLFKLIVKFLAALCLLLAWPLFESKEKDSGADEEERQLEAINDLTELVWNSIFSQRYANGTTLQEDEGIVEKVAGEINEKMTAPGEEAAIGFLEFCVNAANTAVGWAMSFLRRRNNNMDPLENIGWKLWEKLKQMLAQLKMSLFLH